MEKRKYPRFNKSLVAQVVADDTSLFVITSDLSENGLFIRSKRCFSPNASVAIEIVMSDNTVSFLKGIVRRTIETPVNNGMGVEIVEKDANYIHFLKSIIGETVTNGIEKPVLISQIISSSTDQGGNENLKDKIWARRQHKRYKVDDREITVSIGSSNEVKVIDIGIGGISFKTDRRLDLEKQYVLKLNNKDRVITVHGAVKWSSLSEYKKLRSHGDLIPIYTAGIQFTNVSGNKSDELIQLLEGLTKIDTDLDITNHQNKFIDLSKHILSEDVKKILEAFVKTDYHQEDTSLDHQRKGIASKRKSALFCGIEERSDLLKDPNKEVLLAVLENPKITVMEIENLAKLHTIPEEAIKKIVQKREWMNHYGIVSALVSNPKTPHYIAITLVNKLKKKDLKKLEKNRGVSDAIRSVAKKLLYDKV